MRMLGNSILGAAWMACVLAVSPVQAATVLYDNGPTTGEIGAQEFTQFGNDYEVSNSFLLSNAAVIGGVNFTSWQLPSLPGGHITAITWGITATPNSFDTFIASGTASVTSTQLFVNSNGWNVASNNFSTGNISLAAGTYYLVLAHAVAGPSQFPNADGDPSFWDENDGPSTAWQQVTNFAGTTSHSVGSETFQILAATTPVPSALPLFASGLGLLGLAGRRRKRKPAARA